MSTAIRIRRGDTFIDDLTVLDVDGDVLDLTGATVWFTIKDRHDRADTDDDALVKLYWVSGGASSGISVATPASGVLSITIPATDTDLLDRALYLYDVQVKQSSVVHTPIKGYAVVTRDTTRRITTP